MFLRLFLNVLAFLVVTQPQLGHAQVDDKSDSEVAENELQTRLDDLATEFKFTPVKKNAAAFTRSKGSLLSFTNPVRARGQVGSIFVWTQDKRPQVIGSLWTFRGENDSSRLSIELHSLSDTTFTTSLPTIPNVRRTLPIWSPPTSAITWTQLTDAGLRPVSTPLIRSKVRRNADRFSAEVIDPQTGKAQSLRLLSNPIYEFAEGDVLFGGIFAFVLATDPEILMSLEARKSNRGVTLHYAIARMTGRELSVKVDGKDDWHVDRADVWDGTKAYYFCPNVAPF